MGLKDWAPKLGEQCVMCADHRDLISVELIWRSALQILFVIPEVFNLQIIFWI
jgi:hypothetical protein